VEVTRARPACEAATSREETSVDFKISVIRGESYVEDHRFFILVHCSGGPAGEASLQSLPCPTLGQSKVSLTNFGNGNGKGDAEANK
jgi:hypothetical protein